VKGLDGRSIAIGLLLGGVLHGSPTAESGEGSDTPRPGSVEVRTIKLPEGSEDSIRFQKRVKTELVEHDASRAVSVQVENKALVMEWVQSPDEREAKRISDVVLDAVVNLSSEFSEVWVVIESFPITTDHSDQSEWERASLRSSQALRDRLFTRLGPDVHLRDHAQVFIPSPILVNETRFKIRTFESRPPSVLE
jgi:hypothetical protein